MTQRVPEQHRPDIAAYVAMKERHGIKIYDDPMAWVEIVVVNTDLDVAGTLDRLVVHPDFDLPVVLDIKTGPGAIKYGGVEIAAQQWVYASASHWWDGTLHEMPPIDQETALIAHMPAGTGTCQLYTVDLVAGDAIAGMCSGVRDWRTAQTLSLHELVGAEQLLPRRIGWLRDRIRGLTPPARVEAGRTWPADTPRKADEITSHDEVDRIARCLALVETAHRLPFPELDPADEEAAALEKVEPAVKTVTTTASDDWADEGRALLSLLDDEPLGRACGEIAQCADARMTETLYLALQAVVTQVSDPAGVIVARWTKDGPEIVVVPQAESTLAHIHGGKKPALDVARAAARAHGLPSPKSLAQAVENPLLAALAASGTNTQPQEREDQ